MGTIRQPTGGTMSSESKKYRLLTRGDFDGLVCAILLKDLGMLDSIKFLHPKDVQDLKVEVTGNDILTNLPYVAGCHLCFDHHASEETRTHSFAGPNQILNPKADSASRVLYDFYGGRSAFPAMREEMLLAVDKADSAKFTADDILNPRAWVLLSFLMDARTGLGRFQEFQLSNYDLMMELIDFCKEHTIEEVLNLPDVRERVNLYRNHHERFVAQLRRCTTVHGSVAVLDLRNEEVIYVGNRFMIYALFPACQVSVHVIRGLNQQNTVFAVGKSILNRNSKTKIGDLLLTYGGGGHDAAGTCQIDNQLADKVKREIIDRINAEAGTLKEPALV
jgi:nanoRNase/pAp phosphatase (c-di-AMP/oligoRNAs hydrolase)